ncbi:hypothetical protein B0H34DRAFT_675698 [Crassisporium funariophilum]|nr:hypothetical protein B0H34DRAFT_675698 [Crassisporium funariophilum]
MPTYTRPASIPQLSFAPGPYASLPKPPVGTVLYDRVYNDDHVAVKVHLRNILKQNKLTKMPVGFPFHCARDAYGRSCISHASYEFREEFCFSDQRSRSQAALFSYTAPTCGPHSRSGSQMTWRISVPARESSQNRNTASMISIAEVEVDPLVMETPYGLTLMTNPRVILEALAISIEMGILITVAVASAQTPFLHPTKRRLDYISGDIIFIATHNDHNSEVVFVFEA